MTKANGTERGWAPVIVVLVAAILMLVLMTRLATFGGTAALTIEDRWRQAQARRAAENALVRWHRDLREEAVPAIREALGRVAGDPGRYDPRSQVLTGLRFAPIRASYDATPLDGEMRPVGRHVVEVEARVALGGPPEVTNLAGVSAEGRSGAEETYTFLVHATARSRVSEPEGTTTTAYRGEPHRITDGRSGAHKGAMSVPRLYASWNRQSSYPMISAVAGPLSTTTRLPVGTPFRYQ